MDASTSGSMPQNQVIAAAAYLLGPVTGIAFLFVEPYDKDDFVRFHARQSIAFSLAVFAVNVVVSVFIGIFGFSFIGGLLAGLLRLADLAFAVAWVVLMWKAYSGERFRIPYLADLADSFATA